jgi:DNA-binding MarR family transcriptional regulator
LISLTSKLALNMALDLTKPETCTLNALRKLMRCVAKEYDEQLAPVGLRSTQFSLLVTLQKCGIVSISHLAQVLVMERTTLTRNIKPLMDKRLIENRVEKDKRVRLIMITEKGIELLATAEPLWNQAQQRLVEKLGEDRWQHLMSEMSFLTKPEK